MMVPGRADVTEGARTTLSERMHEVLVDSIMRGDFAPRQALKPQELADEHGVSLAVMREALVRLVGDGLAVRSPNRGFAVPSADASRWQLVAEARAAVEPSVLLMAIACGDLEWEAGVKAAYHRLAGTPPFGSDGPPHLSDAWSDLHRSFHRSLLEGCGNPFLLDTFDRMWTASELARRWSADITPNRDVGAEHEALERAVLNRDADLASDTLARHLSLTRTVLYAPNRGEGSNVRR